MAREQGLDLVEVAPNATPPVCRVMDFKKFKYEQEKRTREAKKKQHSSDVKEIKIRPKIAEHDYLVKLKYMEGFIKKGKRVKITMTFRGREMIHMEKGRLTLDRFIQDSSGWTGIEKAPVQDGRNIVVVLKPK